MKKVLNFGLFFGLMTVFIGTTDTFAAKKQSFDLSGFPLLSIPKKYVELSQR